MTLAHDDTDPRARHFPGLSRIGALLADPGRAAMLWSLMDGTARPAGELTMIAGLSPSAASGHLARLTEGGLLAMEVSGRHRYYRIASPDIAAAIEALANLAQVERPAARAPSRLPQRGAARHALRPHLLRPPGGRTAVQIFDRMITRNWLAVERRAENGPTELEPTPKARAIRATRDRLEEPARAPATFRVHVHRLERAAAAFGRRARRGVSRKLWRARLARTDDEALASCASRPPGARHFERFLSRQVRSFGSLAKLCYAGTPPLTNDSALIQAQTVNWWPRNSAAVGLHNNNSTPPLENHECTSAASRNSAAAHAVRLRPALGTHVSAFAQDTRHRLFRPPRRKPRPIRRDASRA